MIRMKIFLQAVSTLFIVSIVVFGVGCANETAAKGKVDDKFSLETQKIRSGLEFFNSGDYKSAINLLDEIFALKLSTVSDYNLRGEYLGKVGEYHYDTQSPVRILCESLQHGRLVVAYQLIHKSRKFLLQARIPRFSD